MSESPNTRCGFVAVVGATNAGKSTLVNQLVGAKVTITSRKVQTTRRRILGIQVVDNAQVIFMDTPGLFTPKTAFEKTMVKAAWAAMYDTDIILFLWDVRMDITKADKALRRMEGLGKPVYLILNKIDLVPRETLLALSAAFNAKFAFEKTYMISALFNQGVSDLLADLAHLMPESPWHFPEDQLSDLPQRLLAAEITREHLFDRLHQELPYSLAVETESWEAFDNGDLRIAQVIHVEKQPQKIIVVGKSGARLKAIGQQARAELSELFGCKVHLFLHVRVTPRWREDRTYLADLCLEDPKDLK
ncbi:MAG: GTPase Era [Candidatus Puniceispirillum sp.]|nr:GTPase Era [Candidatus Puniceispirillum sp.]